MKTRLAKVVIAVAVGEFLAACDMGPYKPEYDEGYRNGSGSIWTTYDKPSRPK